MSDLKEEVAEFCHSQWSGWMEYLFDNCNRNKDGTVVIPKWAVDRWERQLKASYAELSEEEKDSDRAEAEGFLKIIEGKT